MMNKGDIVYVLCEIEVREPNQPAHYIAPFASLELAMQWVEIENPEKFRTGSIMWEHHLNMGEYELGCWKATFGWKPFAEVISVTYGIFPSKVIASNEKS
jgi:hypothetical protein